MFTEIAQKNDTISGQLEHENNCFKKLIASCILCRRVLQLVKLKLNKVKNQESSKSTSNTASEGMILESGLFFTRV